MKRAYMQRLFQELKHHKYLRISGLLARHNGHTVMLLTLLLNIDLDARHCYPTNLALLQQTYMSQNDHAIITLKYFLKTCH
jgi:hypothetical protein